MQFRLKILTQSITMSSLVRRFAQISLTQRNLLQNSLKVLLPACNSLHTSDALNAKWNKANQGPRKWLEYNRTVHPPQKPEEETRKAVIYL